MRNADGLAGIVFAGGVVYMAWYKENVLWKVILTNIIEQTGLLKAVSDREGLCCGI